MRPCTIRISMDQGCAKVAKMLARNKNATCKSELVYTGCPITTVLLQMLSEMMRSKIGRPKRSKIASKSTNLKSLEEADYRDRHYPKKTQIHHLRIREKMSICCMLKVKNVNFFLDETKSFFMAKLNENSVT